MAVLEMLRPSGRKLALFGVLFLSTSVAIGELFFRSLGFPLPFHTLGSGCLGPTLEVLSGICPPAIYFYINVVIDAIFWYSAAVGAVSIYEFYQVE